MVNGSRKNKVNNRKRLRDSIQFAKIKRLMLPFYPLAFSHLSGSISLYFSSGVFGCHSAVLFITSVRYSNRFTLCILQVSAIVQSMAPRSAPLWLPKNNEFFLNEKKCAEISEILNISDNTVRTHIARALKILRKRLSVFLLITV